GKLGAAYAATGQKELAVEHLQASAQCDPDNAYGPGMLGWLAYLEGRPEDALRHYQRADEIEPYNAQLHYQIGLALSSLGRWPEAEERLRRALVIDPNHPGASQALSHVLRQEGQSEESLRFALRAARLTQFENPDILITLADSYASANRPQEAGKAAAKALAVSKAAKFKLTPDIRLRLELLQERGQRKVKGED
ncbi:MAG TPA: tetratricopeptide repeat protein, partial [Pirellulales bacterium]|nr:tetratricopeptide repeat protein [Pirellulales bacterium]